MPAWAAAARLLLLPWARLHALADGELRAQGDAALTLILTRTLTLTLALTLALTLSLRAQGVAPLLAWLGVHLVGVRAGYYTALTLASTYPYPYP